MLPPLSLLLLVLVAFTAAVDQPENSESEDINEIFDMVRQAAPQCNSGFEDFDGSCLLFHENSTTWREAERFCASRGAVLAWFMDEAEHSSVQRFVSTKGSFGYFWIGLSRDEGGFLRWSNGIETLYRGANTLFTNDKEKRFFTANQVELSIMGKKDDSRYTSVCRQYRAGLKGTEKRVDALTNTVKREAIECSLPWRRYKSMCLLHVSLVRSWPEAVGNCKDWSGGQGSLLWLENEAEHIAALDVSAWSPHEFFFSNKFWLGLNKYAVKNTFMWQGLYSESRYRGSNITDPDSLFFYTTPNSTQIHGTSDMELGMSIICRRPL